MAKIIRTQIFWISVLSGLGLALGPILLRWDPVAINTLGSSIANNRLDSLFFFGGFYVLFLVTFIFSLVWSTLFSILEIKNHRAWVALPLLFNLSILILFVPFTEMTVDENFYAGLSSRANVVDKIRSGELKNDSPYNAGLIRLPLGYPALSNGGNEVDFWRDDNGNLNVLFFTHRGVVDNFAGIIYKESNIPPTTDDFGCGTLLDSKKFQENWFWMLCT